MMALKIIGFALVVAFVVGIIISNPSNIPIKYYGLELAYEPSIAETIIFSFLLGMLVATVAFMLDKARLASKVKKQDELMSAAQEEIGRLRIKVMGEPDAEPKPTPVTTPEGKAAAATPTKKKPEASPPTAPSITPAAPSTAPSATAGEKKKRTTRRRKKASPETETDSASSPTKNGEKS